MVVVSKSIEEVAAASHSDRRSQSQVIEHRCDLRASAHNHTTISTICEDTNAHAAGWRWLTVPMMGDGRCRRGEAKRGESQRRDRRYGSCRAR